VWDGCATSCFSKKKKKRSDNGKLNGKAITRNNTNTIKREQKQYIKANQKAQQRSQRIFQPRSNLPNVKRITPHWRRKANTYESIPDLQFFLRTRQRKKKKKTASVEKGRVASSGRSKKSYAAMPLEISQTKRADKEGTIMNETCKRTHSGGYAREGGKIQRKRRK